MEKMTLRQQQTDPESGRITLSFFSLLRTDFIGMELKITTNAEGKVLGLYFSSYRHGTAHWDAQRGIFATHRWESEEELDNVSYVARHYPTILLNGAVHPSFATAMIIPEVLQNLADTQLANFLQKIISKDPGVAKENPVIAYLA